MKKFALLLAGAGMAVLAAGFAGSSPASAAPLANKEIGAATANASVQKVGHSRWRSHRRWGSRSWWHSRWRSHHRWGSRSWWHSRWRSHHRWGSRRY